MVKKRKNKSVEQVEVKNGVSFCKDCKERLNGASAKSNGMCGFCGKMKKYVSRKQEICDSFHAKEI